MRGDDFRVDLKDDAYVGAEVTLFLSGWRTEETGVYFEWSIEGNTRSMTLRGNGAECRFIPCDTEPVAVSVLARSASGQTLADAALLLTAKEFTVNIVKVESPKIVLWDSEAKKDVEVDGIVIGEPAVFEARLTPAYRGRLTSSWSTDAMTAIVEEEGVRITVERGDVGDMELAVSLADDKGFPLGHASGRFAVAVTPARIDDSVRRKNAWARWLEAQGEWKSGEFDLALDTAKKALDSDKDNPELAALVDGMSADLVRVERARKFVSEAEALSGEQKFSDALKAYRRAKAAWSLDGIDQSIEKMEAEVEKLRVAAQRATWLKETANAYDQENRFAEAVKFYRESVAIVPDETLSQRIKRIENRLATSSKAAATIEEARKAEAARNLSVAVAKYKEAIALEPNPAVESHLKELDSVISDRKAKAAQLRREAQELQKKRDDATALVRWRESIGLWPDAEAEKHAAELEKKLGKKDLALRTPEDFGIGTAADAKRILAEAHELYKDGKYSDALSLYRKSYAIRSTPELKNWLDKVEPPIRAIGQANALIKRGNDLYRNGKLVEALAAYKESLKIRPNDQVDEFVKHVESELSLTAKRPQ
jgi:tetratricopeptide (TPR) repeat protein